MTPTAAKAAPPLKGSLDITSSKEYTYFMTYIVYTPSPPLDSFVHRLYYANSTLPYEREKILPMPWLELKVNFGGAFQAYGAEGDQPFATCAESWVTGLWSVPHIVDRPPEVERIGVTFKLGGAYPFLQIPLSELHNQIISLDAIWGSFAAEVRERLYTASTIQARFILFEQLLLARLGEAPYWLKAVGYAIERIASQHGALSIRALSDEMDMSQKHLIEQFKLMVGGTPKELARLYRFVHMIRSIDSTQPVNWTRMAHDSLFYDQSHFNHEFEAFTGHSPTDYLGLRRRVHVEKPGHASYLHLLPTG
jgi:AraC-like DNA-binding protein